MRLTAMQPEMHPVATAHLRDDPGRHDTERIIMLAFTIVVGRLAFLLRHEEECLRDEPLDATDGHRING